MADTTEQTVVYILRQVVQAVENTMETGYISKLDLRGVGQLRFGQDGQFLFVNKSNKSLKQDDDNTSQATSCNTDYRVNKRYLTTLRERPGDYDRETVFSTVRDVLLSSKNVSSATPRSRQRAGFFTPAPNGARPSKASKIDAESIFSAQ